MCNKEFKQLSFFHLKIHNITPREYKKKFNVSTLIDKNISKKISKAASGKNNPMYGKKNKSNLGKKFSKSWRKNISKARKKMGIARGKNNPMYGKSHSEETKKKISEAKSKSMTEGKYNKSCHKSGYFYSKRLKKKIWHDSSYELRALEKFENNPLIVDFDRSKLRIVYIYNGERKTIPDFRIRYLDGKEKIIEVKPRKKIEEIEQEMVKIEAMKEYCKNNNLGFATWTEKSLGI